MVWYIKFEFETTPKKLGELEKIMLNDGRIRFEMPIYEDGSSTIRFIEGKNSSFLRQAEDYFLFVDYCGISLDEYMDDVNDYDFGMHVASTNPDTKKIFAEKVKNYLIKEDIKFKEGEY